ncbi:uncharacterized protein LOC131932452, partial [Physella acuta]|uniref:uncharacterized protein LOC131932452 n=1 Tax=Physella acuta TaxID=109671 RepID=UPI0027DAFB53
QYDCDAAVFCPSVTSTIHSGTKPDHYSKLLTKKAIRAELDLLKHEWTKLSTIPCHTFESILEALAWATQDRDPLVKVRNPSAVMPDVPGNLVGAEHIQVLVIGERELVGNTCAVLLPN